MILLNRILGPLFVVLKLRALFFFLLMYLLSSASKIQWKYSIERQMQYHTCLRNIHLKPPACNLLTPFLATFYNKC